MERQWFFDLRFGKFYYVQPNEATEVHVEAVGIWHFLSWLSMLVEVNRFVVSKRMVFQKSHGSRHDLNNIWVSRKFENWICTSLIWDSICLGLWSLLVDKLGRKISGRFLYVLPFTLFLEDLGALNRDLWICPFHVTNSKSVTVYVCCHGQADAWNPWHCNVLHLASDDRT